MKTAVCRVIEGSIRVDLIETVERGGNGSGIPLKFAGPESMFAIELADDEELKSLEYSGIPQSYMHRPGVGEDGELINVPTGIYLFRAIAVSVVDKSAAEVMADIAKVQELEEAAEQNGVVSQNDGVTKAEEEGSSEGREVSHAEPVPGDQEA